ncbi:uncharacterized protein TNCV_3286031 [Trichonephila clavipes]|nr:uncharacterized protein TNCV_3286031 [Trichonephila clavipes]
MNSDIETLVSQCVISEKFKKANSKEPLKPHTVRYRPFEKIGVDIMDLVYDHLKGLELSSKLDVWVPHVLTERIASQTSRKGSVFEAHHHWGRKMGCIQQRQTQEGMEQSKNDEPAQTISKADIHQKSSYVNPTPLAHADASRDVLPRGGTSQWRPTRFNLYDPEMRNTRGFNVWPETLVQNTATDFAQLKAALSKAFPAIQNKKELETRFYASQQRQNQEPTDFVYDLLKLHKKLELGMSEKALVDHIFVRLEPQVQDYVEVRNSQTAIQLLEVLAKFEERYS